MVGRILTLYGGSTFETRLDGGVFGSIGGATTDAYGALSLTTHIFEVRAVDPAGNMDPTSALHVWTIPYLIANGTGPVTISFDAPFDISNWTLTSTVPGIEWDVDATPAAGFPPGGPFSSAPGQPELQQRYRLRLRGGTQLRHRYLAHHRPFAVGDRFAPVPM